MSKTMNVSEAKRREYQKKADAELRAWSARIDELMARAQAHEAAGKIAMYKRLEKLGEQRDSVRERLAELRETGGDAWDDVRDGFEQAIYELSGAFHSAIDRFRESSDQPIAAQAASRDSDTSPSTGA